jgi:hypothetical protein
VFYYLSRRWRAGGMGRGWPGYGRSSRPARSGAFGHGLVSSRVRLPGCRLAGRAGDLADGVGVAEPGGDQGAGAIAQPAPARAAAPLRPGH